MAPCGTGVLFAQLCHPRAVSLQLCLMHNAVHVPLHADPALWHCLCMVSLPWGSLVAPWRVLVAVAAPDPSCFGCCCPGKMPVATQHSLGTGWGLLCPLGVSLLNGSFQLCLPLPFLLCPAAKSEPRLCLHFSK